MEASRSQSKNESKPNSGAGESTLGDEICYKASSLFRETCRAWTLEWLEALEPDDTSFHHPPTCIVLHADLVTRGWGWKRLVPCGLRDVAWPDLKRYFVNYFENNDSKIKKLICKMLVQKSDEEVVEHDDLIAAINKCIETEDMLVMNCITDFNLEGLILSAHLKENLNQLLQSGYKSSASAAALLCITKENELILDISSRGFEVKKVISFDNVIRRCASNFLLYKGSESDSNAAAGVMLGMAKEAEMMTHSSEGEQCYESSDYLICEHIRQRAVESLIELEKELITKTANTDADGTPAGVNNAGDLRSMGSGSSVGNSEENMSNNGLKVPSLANTKDKDFDG